MQTDKSVRLIRSLSLRMIGGAGLLSCFLHTGPRSLSLSGFRFLPGRKPKGRLLLTTGVVAPVGLE